MRRFIGYITIVITLILTVVFNIQVQTESLRSGLEYGGGYEAVYRVNSNDSGLTVENIAEILTERVEEAEVRNANVESFTNLNSDEDQIRIKANSNTEADFEYILRSVEATGTITLSTVMDGGDYGKELESPFKIGSAKVGWQGSTPYVEVDVKDYEEFNQFVTACNDAYKEFEEKYNNSEEESESTIEGVIVIWLDKVDTDSYLEAFQGENEVVQELVKNKVLSIIPTSYFQVQKDQNDKVTSAKLLIDRYDFDQIQMVGDSAHTIERLLNYEPQEYTLERLYVQRVNSIYSNNSQNLVLIGCAVAFALVAILLIVRFGLAGLAGASSFGISMFLALVVFNFFDYPITTMVILAFIISMVFNLGLVVPYLESFREELYKGKTPIKASQEAIRLTRITTIDIFVVSMIASIASILISINQVKLLPITIVITTLVSIIVNRLLLRLMMWWLCGSKVGENKKCFLVKTDKIPDVSKDEVQQVFNSLNKFDPIKNGKKTGLITSIVTAVSAIAILVISLIPGLGTFNYSSEFNSTTRVEIHTEVSTTNYLFDTRSEVEDFFETEYDLTPSNVYINLVENVIVDSSNRDDLPTVAYISIGFDGNVEFDIDELTQKIHELDYGDEAIIDVGTTKSHMPTYILTYSLITLFVFGLVGSVYYLIRFKYSYGLASLSTIIPAGVVSVALFVCTRIATSPLVVMGIASGLFIAALSQVPLFSRMKKLTRESKVKVTTYEQRKNIVVQSVQETLHICMSIAVLGVVSLLAIAFFVPIDLITVFIGAIIALLIATVLLCFLFTPVYLAIEKYAYNVKLANLSKSQERRERKGKKRLQKIKEAHKKVGSEPEEATIIGIND